MHIVHVMGKTSRLAGGLFETVPGLANALITIPGVTVSVIGVNDNPVEHDGGRWTCYLETLDSPRWAPRKLLYSPGMLATTLASQASLVLCHGLWTHHNWVVLQWAKRTGRPYMVVPHGMMDVVDLRKSPLKKWLARKLYVDPLLSNASCLRAISDSEARSIRGFGVRRPICLLPNGVILPRSDSSVVPEWRRALPKNAKVLFYIGRINPKKGLPALIDAWAQIKLLEPFISHDWHLVIAGWDQNGHEATLKSQAQSLGLLSQVHFVGPLFQSDKHAAFRSSDAFVLPSTSEGLPTVVLEAWSYNLPVLMTPECNIPEGFSSEAALRIERNSKSLMDGLRALFQMDAPQRKAMGEKGRVLVEKTFSWPSIARDMVAVFHWMLGLADKPRSVTLN